MTTSNNLKTNQDMIMVATECPQPSQLQGFVIGTLDESEAEMLHEHTDSCPNCQKAIQKLEQVDDPFLQELRNLQPDPKRESNPPELSAALNRVRRFKIPLPKPERTTTVREIGPYQVESRLGVGGMGTVYRARHRRLDKAVALKVIPNQGEWDRDAARRFEREMTALGSLDHANLVRAYDAGESDDQACLYLAMELVEGLDAGQLVSRMGPLRIADACEILRQTALGLDSIHQQGLVHRDIKPSNVMLAHSGDAEGKPQAVVKVLDLGLARFHNLKDELTLTGQVVGTLDYLSPEQAGQKPDVGPASDLYSLGCMAFKLLTGRAPFAEDSSSHPLMKLQAHTEKAPPRLGTIRPEVPKKLAALVMKLLSKQPADRFAQAAEVARALKPFCKGHDLPHLLKTAEHQTATAQPEAVDTDRQNAAGTKTQTTASPIDPEETTLVPALSRSRESFDWVSTKWIAAAAGMLLMLGIIIIVRHPGGTETRHPVDDVKEVIVDVPSGRVTIVPKSSEESAPKRNAAIAERRSGEPLSRYGVLTQAGVLPDGSRFDINTIAPRGYTGLAEFRPDGKQVATLGGDRLIRLWDTASGEFVRAFLPSYLHRPVGQNQSLAFSPDGKILAHAHGEIHLWEVATGRLIRVIHAPNYEDAAQISFSPDGKLLAAGEENVRLWEVATGKQLDMFPLEETTWVGAPPRFSPDGKQLVVLQHQHINFNGIRLTVWSVDQGQRLAVLEPPLSGNNQLRPDIAWSPSGHRLAMVEGTYNILQWETRNWNQLPVEIKRKTHSTGGLAWSKDGKELAIGVDWFDAKTGKLLRSVAHADPEIRTVLARLPGGELEFLADGMEYTQSRLVIRDGRTGKTLSRPATRHEHIDWIYVPGKENLHNFAWLTNDEYAWNQRARSLEGEMFRGLTEVDAKRLLRKGPTYWYNVGSPDGSRYCEVTDEGITLKSLDKSKTPVVLEGSSDGLHQHISVAVTWSRDGKRIAAACEDRRVRVWDSESGKLISNPTGGMEVMAFSPDGQVLATAGTHHGVFLWDVETGKLRHKLSDYGSFFHLNVVCWNDAGTRVAVIDIKGKMGVWDATTGERLEDSNTIFGRGCSNPNGTVTAFVGTPNVMRFWQFDGDRDLGGMMLLNRDRFVRFGPGGHYAGSPNVERDLIYIVDDGKSQQTYTAKEFAEKYDWKNDPAKAQLSAVAN